MTKLFCLNVVAAVGVLLESLQAAALGRGFGGYYGNPYSDIRGGGAGGWPVQGFDSHGFIAGAFGGTGADESRFDQGASYGAGFDGEGLPADRLNASQIQRGDSAGFRYGATLGLGQLGALRGTAVGAEKRAPGETLGGQGFGALNGLRYFSPTYLHAQAIATQRWCTAHACFTPGWIAAHPWAWHPARKDVNAWTTAAWTVADWPSLETWLGWKISPIDYRYGDNVVYEDGKVYFDGDRLGATAGEYYRQAIAIAHSDSPNVPDAPNVSDNADWSSLGIFAIVQAEQKKPTMMFQLAVDKQGTVHGNCVTNGSEKMSAVQGAVDKNTQRIAWTVGDAKSTVYETGLVNLTKDEAPGLMHCDKDRTELILFVRLKPDQDHHGQN